jgi:RNase H-fold protein (predicted Holliday junction resolvase)
VIVAIDAGVRKCGVAFFDADGVLKGALTVRNPDKLNRGVWAWRCMVDAVFSSIVAPDVLIIETMQNDGRIITDALDVQAVCGMIIGRASCEVITYTPRVWKGQAPKAATIARIKRDLTPAELDSIDPNATHDAYDAIGIGRFYFSN